MEKRGATFYVAGNMAITLISLVFLLSAVGDSATPQAATFVPLEIYENPIPPKPAGEIDRIVFRKLSSLKIQPSLCSDAVFVRRVYLDVIGTLPTAKEVRDFIHNPDTANKRRQLIDRLLEREEFADYWAMKWADILRIKAEFPVNLWPNAAQAYHRWVRSSIAGNKPYDKFVREMLTSSGSNFRVGPVNFYRAVQNRTPEGLAGAVALTFMGSRIDAWPKERLAGMAVFFSQVGYKPTNEWKEEHVFWDPFHCCSMPGNTAPGQAAIDTLVSTASDASKAVSKPPVDSSQPAAVFPDGTNIRLSTDRDPREVFAEWLITPRNPWFTRCIANRIWEWLLGRGIIHEPDDIRPDNPPSNSELLTYLEREMVAGHYDLKRFYRLILNSNTYQLSSVPRFANPQAEANFACYPLRRLDAEVLIDAINKITGTSDLYTSAIPEPFTYIPKGKSAISIADGSITSPFLALFGRSARATGMETERINKPVPSQWLHMLNSSHIQRKLEQGPALKAIIDSGRKPAEIAEELYLTILSRPPTAEELHIIEDYGISAIPNKPADASKQNTSKIPNEAKKSVAKPTAGNKPPVAKKQGKTPTNPKKAVAVRNRAYWVDIAWALINSTEFLYRH